VLTFESERDLTPIAPQVSQTRSPEGRNFGLPPDLIAHLLSPGACAAERVPRARPRRSAAIHANDADTIHGQPVILEVLHHDPSLLLDVLRTDPQLISDRGFVLPICVNLE
jgi:hypothetical protein